MRAISTAHRLCACERLGGYAVDQLQRCEGKLVNLGTTLVSGPVTARLAVLFSAAIDQVLTCFAQPLHKKPGRAQ
jgi:hypothetical protein